MRLHLSPLDIYDCRWWLIGETRRWLEEKLVGPVFQAQKWCRSHLPLRHAANVGITRFIVGTGKLGFDRPSLKGKRERARLPMNKRIAAMYLASNLAVHGNRMMRHHQKRNGRARTHGEVMLFLKASQAAQRTAVKAENEFIACDWLLPWLIRSGKVIP